ncbi:hypothetical protein [Bradyrhizobium sp.]|uniref:hypothetical protein n=1 Tax=Bradyrhizobium sp. TaxID=376 RepID=UPI001D9FCC23|nr:hypothetical protein [Bradyrhizobium sp.]MBI5321329.1 hypothetical protein [Bradyrhizobium sp.]
MAINEGFDLAHSLPLASDVPIERTEPGNARDGAVASSRVLKVSVLIAAVAATAIAAAVLSARGPATPDADVTAALAANSKLPPDTDQSAPETQSTVGVTALLQPAAEPQVSPPAANYVPTREEMAAAEPAGKDQAETSVPTSETLFKQFQAWAAEQDAQPSYRPLVQDVPASAVKRVAGNAPAPSRLVQKRRYVRPVQNARAEARPENVRKKLRRAPSARAARPPVEEARTQGHTPGRSVQDAQASSFLPVFGWRN